MKTKTAVVTGCTGAIGTALLRLLIRQDYRIFAVVRPDSERNANIPQSENIQIIPCSLENIGSLPSLITEPCDLFFHMGWAATFGASRNDMLRQCANITAAVQAVHAAHTLGCHAFIGAGSQAEYGRKEEALTPALSTFPENGYGMAKLCAGQMTRQICDTFGMRHLWFRILSVYGIHDGAETMIMSAITRMMQGERCAFTKGEQLWDYLYADDAARAMLLAAERCNKSAVYCLGSGQPRRLAEYITEIRDLLHPELEIGLGDIPYAEKQVMCLYADISDLTNDTGFVPEISFAEGIRRIAEWLHTS